MLSTAVPIIIVAVCILLAFFLSGGAANAGMGLYGIALAAVGMLSHPGHHAGHRRLRPCGR